ncbi:hypothetical protein PoB_002560900 [Plakobranchus ocellatus]|uniref:Uncharacterized protein n=1 Tax=Plakobranchus ocellatus TaxID=259542 RepID=A0AAV3ZUT9_9GAST|nr:hypothetical protein PoB_002560900 [Plakobranchus ocellatus]
MYRQADLPGDKTIRCGQASATFISGPDSWLTAAGPRHRRTGTPHPLSQAHRRPIAACGGHCCKQFSGTGSDQGSPDGSARSAHPHNGL